MANYQSLAHRGIIIFARNPELGKVKTRLASTIGDDRALKIYIELLRHTRDVVSQSPHEKFVFYSDEVLTGDLWPEDTFHKSMQAGGDLGNRIKEAFKYVFESCDSCIIVGSDCPRLTSAHISEAFEILEDHDTVIGPTYDGGYYLIGMNQYQESLFEDIRWSSDEVYDKTIAKIIRADLSHRVLEKLSDVDYEEDWIKWGWEL